MAEIDKVKEQIGWLKVLFGLSVAIDISLIAWIAQHFTSADVQLLLLAIVAQILLTLAIFFINMSAQKKIDRLENL